MGRALDVTLKVIPSKVAIPFVKRHHYSGKVVNNSNLQGERVSREVRHVDGYCVNH